MGIVEQYLRKIKVTPKDKALEIRCRQTLNEQRKKHKELVDKKEKLQKRLHELSMEVGKSFTGESTFSVDVLSMAIESNKSELSDVEKMLMTTENATEIQKNMLKKIDYYYDQFISWADEFNQATLEQKKMVICQLIRSVKVGKGYNIEVELNASYKQFFDEETYSKEVI